MRNRVKHSACWFVSWDDEFVQELTRYFCRHTPTHQDAEDLTNKTLLAAWEADHSEAPYVYGIARHKLFDFYRQRHPQQEKLDLETLAQDYYSSLGLPEPETIRNEEANQVEAALEMLITKGVLKELDKVILSLYLVGFSDKEIVETLHLSVTPKRVSNRRGEIQKALKTQVELPLKKPMQKRLD